MDKYRKPAKTATTVKEIGIHLGYMTDKIEDIAKKVADGPNRKEFDGLAATVATNKIEQSADTAAVATALKVVEDKLETRVDDMEKDLSKNYVPKKSFKIIATSASLALGLILSIFLLIEKIRSF